MDASPDHMVVQTGISVTLLYLDHITSTGASLYGNTKFYTFPGVLCYLIAAVLSIFNNIVVTRYPMVDFQNMSTTTSTQ